MVGCIQDNMLIGMLEDELPPTESATIRAHLAECPVCRARADALEKTWKLLGNWEVTPAGQFADRVLAAARTTPPRLQWWPLAASLLLAIGLGASAALFRPAPPAVVTARAPVSSEEVVQILGLDVLGQESTALEEIMESPLHAEEEHS